MIITNYTRFHIDHTAEPLCVQNVRKKGRNGGPCGERVR